MKMWREKAPEMRSFVTVLVYFYFTQNFVVRKMGFKKINKESAQTTLQPFEQIDDRCVCVGSQDYIDLAITMASPSEKKPISRLISTKLRRT